jgi:Flp pilus assembly protein TadG
MKQRARHSRGWRALMRLDDGATSIEFLIVAVAVLAIMFTAIQGAMYFWAKSIAQAAAREGVNAQRAYGAPPGAGRGKANDFIDSAGGALTATTVAVTSDPQQVRVTVTGHCLSVIPSFCQHVPIKVTVAGTVEQATNP